MQSASRHHRGRYLSNSALAGAAVVLYRWRHLADVLLHRWYHLADIPGSAQGRHRSTDLSSTSPDLAAETVHDSAPRVASRCLTLIQVFFRPLRSEIGAANNDSALGRHD